MIKPTKKQLDFLDWEMGLFFHFGIRTFYDGHKDWDMQEMPLEGFDPTELDCRQWIKCAKEAGANYAILVTKHHDGFANWPSAFTDYSVKNTPWKDGKGDVVREFTDACREAGLGVGLYYSPADFAAKERTDKEHDDFFINQIGELLSNYGKIDYLWFDGCGSEGHEYNKPRIIREIRRLQPDILIFNMWDPDTRWVGNECGVAPSPNYNVVENVDFSIMTEEKDGLEEARFLPAECDCTLRMRNWFYSDSDTDTVKSLDELIGMYELSVGRGANLLINIGPDRRGLLPEPDATRMKEFGAEIRRRYATPVAKITVGKTEFASPVLLNQVVLCEELTNGEKAEAFELWGHTVKEGRPILLYRGATIGHKAICTFPAVMLSAIELKITEEKGSTVLKSADAYFIK